MTKEALGPCTWATACVRGQQPAYVGRGLCMQTKACIRRHIPASQLGFQKHKKCKFFAIMAEVWNESCSVWESFQTPSFQL